jgi:alpha-glucosidase
MYPGVTPAIRSAIELRYRLLPYLYTLLWQAHADDEPMLRPTFLDHEHDRRPFAERRLPAGPRSAGGQRGRSRSRQRRVWLPANQTGWYDFTPRVVRGGQWIVRDAPLEKLPLLVAPGGCRSASESATLARRRMIPVS